MTGTVPPTGERPGERSDSSDPAPMTDGEAIELALPARAELAPMVHVLAAAIGAQLGFSVDEIEDVNLALSETLHAADTTATGRVTVTFRPCDGRLTIDVVVDCLDAIALDDRALAIARAVVDDLVVAHGSVSFVKHATESVS